MSDTISVVCRLRPFNPIQIRNAGRQCVEFQDNSLSINLHDCPKPEKHDFTFDAVFQPEAEQLAVYKRVGLPILQQVFSGVNGTIMAYGQTGGGKTWTMQGPNHTDEKLKGLIPRTMQGLFQIIQSAGDHQQFTIRCSYMEIYNQKIQDLLDPSKVKLQLKEDKTRGVFVQNITEVYVASFQDVMKLMQLGASNRKVAFTGMNQKSSRSHSIFFLAFQGKDNKLGKTRQSRLCFVDLAGSQKVSKTGVTGTQLDEAKNINKSLTTLGMVINSLTSQKAQHIPYRDSKLTRVLQDSLGGNSKTTLVINCSICSFNDKQTLSTLRFGMRAKKIKNKPIVNQQKSVKQLMMLLQQARRTISSQQLLIDKQSIVSNESRQQSQSEELIELRERVKQLLLQNWEKKQEFQKQKNCWSTQRSKMLQEASHRDFCLCNLRDLITGLLESESIQIIKRELSKAKFQILNVLSKSRLSLQGLDIKQGPPQSTFFSDSQDRPKDLSVLLSDDMLSQFSQKLDLKDQIIAKLQNQISLLQNKLQHSEQQNNQLKQTSNKSRLKFQQLSVSLSQKQADWQSKQVELYKIINDFRKSKDCSAISQRQTKLIAQLNELKEQAVDKQDEIEQLQGEIRRLKDHFFKADFFQKKQQFCKRCKDKDYEQNIFQGQKNIAKVIKGGKSPSLLQRLTMLF